MSNEAGQPDIEAMRKVQDHLSLLDYNRAQAFLLPEVDRDAIYMLVAPSYCDPEKFADCLDAFCVEGRARADQILAHMAEALRTERRMVVKRLREAMPDWFPCRCHDAYKGRDLEDPDCPTHDIERWLDEIGSAR